LASYASGVQIAIERGEPGAVSGESASTTPPASAARYLAGTVSRCFASSAYSKVPRKIKVVHEFGRSSNPGGWVGGALPPGSYVHAWPTVTHFPPLCNPNATLIPTRTPKSP
jgi:hypothetical protein